MEKINLDFLYYIVPEKYRYLLDGERDPMESHNYDELAKFSEHMKECPLDEYVKIIFQAFLIKYPNAAFLYSTLVKDEYNDTVDLSVRDEGDILSIGFNYKNISGTNVMEQYLFSLRFDFKDFQPDLRVWIEDAMEENGKKFRYASGVIHIKDSPVLKVGIEDKSLTIFMDKKKYTNFSF